jgi:hypothetical protein
MVTAIQEIEKVIQRLPSYSLEMALEYLRALEKEDGIWMDIPKGDKRFFPYDRLLLTGEENQALEKAEAEINQGEGISLDEIKRKYGL